MGSPGTELTPEQRQQIIAALLVNRRDKPSTSTFQDEERTQKVQQLIRQRAAARQQHSHSPAQGLNAHLFQQPSLDELLSPGSTCSLQSNSKTHNPASNPALVGQQHNGQQQYASEPIAAADAKYAQRTQQQLAVQDSQEQQLQAAFEGPVDVSQLWTSPSEQVSAASLQEDADGSCSTQSNQSAKDGQRPYQQRLWQQGVKLRQQMQQPCFKWPGSPDWQTSAWQGQAQQHKPTIHEDQMQHQQQLQQRGIRSNQQREQQQQQQPKRQQQEQQMLEHVVRPESAAAPRSATPSGRLHSSGADRLQELAKPKTGWQRCEQLKQAAEQQELQHCSFAPKTGRGPQHNMSHQSLPAADRLYMLAAEKQAKLERRLAEQDAAGSQGCTFKPQTNSAANARHLAAYEYVPLHQRLNEVLRSKKEKLAQVQARVELENRDVTFAPCIGSRSSMLASRQGRVGSVQQDDAASPPDQQQRARSANTGTSLRRSRSTADRLARQADCSFSPHINPTSKAMLQASGDIPAEFLQRQQYFDRLAREKKLLLQLALEDQHCSFSPKCGSNPDCSDDCMDESYLERIERLAYHDRRNTEAARSALAEQMYSSECTFSPAINQRSQHMAKATPLQELHENSRGKVQRDAVALAVQMRHEQECTFSPSLSKLGAASEAPPGAKLSLSSSEVDEVVKRLHRHQQHKDDKVEAAVSFKEYQDLKQCTFTPDITRTVPKQEGPVLVRGLGRFLELKDMARKQAEHKAQVEAKVFLTQLKPRKQPFTVPQPFKLGRGSAAAAARALKRDQVEALALEAARRECTFKPQISSSHNSRQHRVKQLLSNREAVS